MEPGASLGVDANQCTHPADGTHTFKRAATGKSVMARISSDFAQLSVTGAWCRTFSP